MHGFFIDKEEKTLSFDIIIDFKMPNREEIYKDIYDQVQEKFQIIK